MRIESLHACRHTRLTVVAGTPFDPTRISVLVELSVYFALMKFRVPNQVSLLSTAKILFLWCL